MKKTYHLIIGSSSPRRHQLLKTMGLEAEIRVRETDETYPPHLQGCAITDYIARKKAIPFRDELKDTDILLTADTIVWHRNQALGKPADADAARQMLTMLSGDCHQAITSVCFTNPHFQETARAVTNVYFKPLSVAEIEYYIEHYQPFDKAGAYAIQEWIGCIGVARIEGSYTNIMGLPTQLVYDTWRELTT